jgi:hypothetical protein
MEVMRQMNVAVTNGKELARTDFCGKFKNKGNCVSTLSYVFMPRFTSFPSDRREELVLQIRTV